MSSLLLKILGIIIIIIDYIGLVFMNNNPILRFIGRAAFPIYGLLLVEGYRHTKDNPKRLFRYMLSLLLLALVTEPLYDKLYFDTYFYLYSQNVIFTLLISLICMVLYDKMIKRIDKIISFIIIIYFSIMSMLFKSDFGMFGVLLIFVYYVIIDSNLKKKIKFLLLLLTDIIYIVILFFLTGGNMIYLGILPSLIPIILYNGEKGYKSNFIKYLFYFFYPFLLLIVLLIM